MSSSECFVLSRAASREIDAAAVSELGMTGPLLMENAARGVCDVVRQHFQHAGRIVIAAGPGNNGGDGLALARQLAACQLTSNVYLVSASRTLTDDAQFNLRILKAAGMGVAESDDGTDLIADLLTLEADDLIVDCLLGTGVRGAIREPFLQIVEAINQSVARVLAVDVPSGLDCDTGTAEGGCVVADHTVTFVGWKRGFQNPEAAQKTGRVTVAHIGLPDAWVSQWLRTR